MAFDWNKEHMNWFLIIFININFVNTFHFKFFELKIDYYANHRNNYATEIKILKILTSPFLWKGEFKNSMYLVAVVL